MTDQFIQWFNSSFPNGVIKGEEREALQLYTWLSWRDSRKNIGEPVAYYANGRYYNTEKAAIKDGGENIIPLYEINS